MFNFKVLSQTRGQITEFSAPLFPPELGEILCQFNAASESLNETSFVRNWSTYNLSIHLANDGQISNAGMIPPDEDTAAFLHRLRPFYLNNETLNFNKIANRISQHFRDPEISSHMKECKDFYRGKQSQSVFDFKIQGTTINSESFLDDYLNALEYHRDPTRIKKIGQIATRLPTEAQKVMIVLLLGLRLNAINKMSSFILTCFDREDGRPITLRIP